MNKSNKVFLTAIGGAFVVVAIFAGAYRYITANSSDYSSGLKLAKWETLVIGNNLLTKTMSLPAFSSISADGNFDVEVSQGQGSNILVSTDKTTLSQVKVSVSGSDLNLMQNQSAYTYDDSSKLIKATITTKAIKTINLNGDSVLHMKNIRANNLEVNMAGDSVGYLQGDMKNIHINMLENTVLHVNLVSEDAIDLKISGNGKVELTGATKALSINSIGNATIDASKLTANNVDINATGASSVIVHAAATLSVDATGESAIQYYGNPVVTKNVIGESTVEQVGTDYSSAN